MLPSVPCSAAGGILAAAEGAGKAVADGFLQEHGSYVVVFTTAGSETSLRLCFFPKKTPAKSLQNICSAGDNLEQGKTKETQQGISCM